MSAALDLFAMDGGHPVDADGQAGREDLANLCRPLGADPERVAEAMVQTL